MASWIRRVRRYFWEQWHTRPDPAARESFAAFLDRLRAGPVTREDWLQHVTGHYYDFWLEDLRREFVRSYIVQDPAHLSDAYREQLRALASRIRAQC